MCHSLPELHQYESARGKEEKERKLKTFENEKFSIVSYSNLCFTGIDLFTTHHKVVHNGGSPKFKGLLLDKKTNYLAQILQSLSYKVCSIILPKFNTFGLFIPILDTSAIMYQAACCYNVTASETGLYSLPRVFTVFMLFWHQDIGNFMFLFVLKMMTS